MPIITNDDGSTIDTDLAGTSAGATQSPPGYLVSDYATNFNPANLSPGATSMMDVLKYGFGRLVDYKVASIQPQNTPAQYSAQASAPTPGGGGKVAGLSPQTILIGVGLLVVAAIALGGSNR